MIDTVSYQAYCCLLKKELICAMGCTEPIAIAYCAAVSRAALGGLPDKVQIVVSGNIVKNVKSVIVPNTGNRKASRPPPPSASSEATSRRSWRSPPE